MSCWFHRHRTNGQTGRPDGREGRTGDGRPDGREGRTDGGPHKRDRRHRRATDFFYRYIHTHTYSYICPEGGFAPPGARPYFGGMGFAPSPQGSKRGDAPPLPNLPPSRSVPPIPLGVKGLRHLHHGPPHPLQKRKRKSSNTSFRKVILNFYQLVGFFPNTFTTYMWSES